MTENVEPTGALRALSEARQLVERWRLRSRDGGGESTPQAYRWCADELDAALAQGEAVPSLPPSEVCPVCGFYEVGFLPKDYNICASCGTEFGASDSAFSHAELHQYWVDEGCPWFDPGTPKPEGWDRYCENLKAPRVLINGVPSYRKQPASAASLLQPEGWQPTTALELLQHVQAGHSAFNRDGVIECSCGTTFSFPPLPAAPGVPQEPPP